MARIPVEQFSFRRGQLSENFANRAEQDAYHQGALEIRNGIIDSNGAVISHGKWESLAHSDIVAHFSNKGYENNYFIPFAVSEQQAYVILLYSDQHHEHVITASVFELERDSGDPDSWEVVDDSDIDFMNDGPAKDMGIQFVPRRHIKSGDVAILFGAAGVDGVLGRPLKISRIYDSDAERVRFKIEHLAVTNFPAGKFSTDGYPRTGAFWGGRLWLSGHPGFPNTIWASRTNDYFNFSLSDTLADYGIEYTIRSEDTKQVEFIGGSTHLTVFTDNNVLYVPQQIITPSNMFLLEVFSHGMAPGSVVYPRAVNFHQRLVYTDPVSTTKGFVFVGSDRKTLWQMEYDNLALIYEFRPLNLTTPTKLDEESICGLGRVEDIDAGMEYFYICKLRTDLPSSNEGSPGGFEVYCRSVNNDSVMGWTHLDLPPWPAAGSQLTTDSQVYRLFRLDDVLLAGRIHIRDDNEIRCEVLQLKKNDPSEGKMVVRPMPVAPVVQNQNLSWRKKRPVLVRASFKDADSLEVEYNGQVKTLVAGDLKSAEKETGQKVTRLAGHTERTELEFRTRADGDECTFLGWSAEVEVGQILRGG